jgi:hypothetical protein
VIFTADRFLYEGFFHDLAVDYNCIAIVPEGNFWGDLIPSKFDS